MIDTMVEQRTDEWKKMRLGFFNGSEVGNLMGSGRKKDEVFGQTAKSYIYKVAGERHLSDETLNDEMVWNKFDWLTNISNRAMDFGTETEPMAKATYEEVTGNRVEETTTTRHPSVKWFAASPDGLVEEFGRKGVVEIKCPSYAKHEEYRQRFNAGETLKDINAIYYWQVQAEMMVTGTAFCDFVVYCPFIKNDPSKDISPIIIKRIQADDAAQAELKMRIELANQMIGD